MCRICVEYTMGKLTAREAVRNARETSPTPPDDLGRVFTHVADEVSEKTSGKPVSEPGQCETCGDENQPLYYNPYADIRYCAECY